MSLCNTDDVTLEGFFDIQGRSLDALGIKRKVARSGVRGVIFGCHRVHKAFPVRAPTHSFEHLVSECVRAVSSEPLQRLQYCQLQDECLCCPFFGRIVLGLL